MKRFLLPIGLLIIFCTGCGSAAVNLQIDQEVVIQPTDDHLQGLSPSQIETLSSLEQVDDFPVYTMEYVGEYANAGDLVENRPTAAFAQVPWACTLFTALADEGNRIYGRNFDWDYSPVLLLYSYPPDGYSSVSIVDLAYFEFSSEELSRLNDLALPELTPLLEAPWWPFDGMNQHGLAIGMAAVPSGNMSENPQKRTIGSLEIMREVLDHAMTVEEALVIFQDYNIDMRGGPDLHYLVADRTGDAILIEFYRGEMIVIQNMEPWHLATNFLCSAADGSPEGRCRRYDTVYDELAASGGAISLERGMDLLEMVSQQNTQWSVIYGISTGQVNLVVGQEYQQVLSFNLEMAEK